MPIVTSSEEIFSTVAVPRKRTHSLSRIKARLSYVAFVCLYGVLVLFCYQNVLADLYGYWGFRRSSTPIEAHVLSYCLAVIPSLWLRTCIVRPSDLIVCMTYLLVYMPAVLVVPFAGRPVIGTGDGILFAVLLFCSLLVLQTWGRLPLRRVRHGRSRKNEKWVGTVFWALFFIAVLVCGAASINTFTLAKNFEQVYDVRSVYIASQKEDTLSFIAAYAGGWLFGTLGPMLFARFWMRRKLWLGFGLSCGISLLVYGTTAFKIVLVEPLILLAIVYAYRTSKGRLPVRICGFLVVMLLPLAFLTVQDIRQNTILSNYCMLGPYRSIGVPALLLVQYWQFFADHPVSYLSHVRGVSSFLTYPYQGPMSEVVGRHYYGVPGANACTWATDGFGAFGFYGPLIASMMMGAVLWLYDTLCSDENSLVATLCISYIGIYVAVASMFTALLTDGWLLLILLLLVTRPGWLSGDKHRLASRNFKLYSSAQEPDCASIRINVGTVD